MPMYIVVTYTEYINALEAIEKQKTHTINRGIP